MHKLYGVCVLARWAIAYADLAKDTVGHDALRKEIHREVVDQDSLAFLQHMSIQLDAGASMTPAVPQVSQRNPQSMDFNAELVRSETKAHMQIDGNTFYDDDSCMMAIKHKISTVEAIKTSLSGSPGRVTEMAVAVQQLLDPANRALVSWSKGLQSAADFELVEFSLLLQSGFLKMYLCDTSTIPEEMTAPASASVIYSIGETLRRECPHTLLNDTTHALDVVMKAVRMGLRCHKAGLDPTKTSEERQMAFEEAEIKNVTQRIPLTVTARDSTSSSVDARVAFRLEQFISFAFSMPHRKRYLEEARPGIVQLMEKYFIGRNFTSTADILLAHEKLKSNFHPDEKASSNNFAFLPSEKDPHNGSTGHRRRGTCNPGHRRRGQAGYNFDKHPFRTRALSAYDNGDGDWWSPRRRRTFKRDEYKDKFCPGDSEKNLDDLFETDCAYNGCTSPSPMLYLDVMSPTCFIHDVCYICGPGVVNQYYCDDAFYDNMMAECKRKMTGWNLWKKPICDAEASIVWLAVAVGGKWPKVQAGPWCQTECARKAAFGPDYQEHLKMVDNWYR